MPEGLEDSKVQICLEFILERLAHHENKHDISGGAPHAPLFVGVNGVQGCGKTTLVSSDAVIHSSKHSRGSTRCLRLQKRSTIALTTE